MVSDASIKYYHVPVVKFLIEGLAGQNQLHIRETQLNDETRVVHCFFLELRHLRNIAGNDHLQKRGKNKNMNTFS